jgi:hypothetical protein
MMEAVSTSETVNFYETMRCNNPEDSHLQAADGEQTENIMDVTRSV